MDVAETLAVGPMNRTGKAPAWFQFRAMCPHCGLPHSVKRASGGLASITKDDLNCCVVPEAGRSLAQSGHLFVEYRFLKALLHLCPNRDPRQAGARSPAQTA